MPASGTHSGMFTNGDWIVTGGRGSTTGGRSDGDSAGISRGTGALSDIGPGTVGGLLAGIGSG